MCNTKLKNKTSNSPASCNIKIYCENFSPLFPSRLSSEGTADGSVFDVPDAGVGSEG